jgi:hypothetical protein
LPGRTQEPLLITLAVDGHQVGRQFGENADRNGAAAEMGA